MQLVAVLIPMLLIASSQTEEATEIQETSDVKPVLLLSAKCEFLLTRCNDVGFGGRYFYCQHYGYLCLPKSEPVTDCTQERENCDQLSLSCQDPDNANRFEECKIYGQKCFDVYHDCPVEETIEIQETSDLKPAPRLSAICETSLTRCNDVGFAGRYYYCQYFGYVCSPKREPVTDCTQERQNCDQLSVACHNHDNANRFEECKIYGQKCRHLAHNCPVQEATETEGTSDVTPAPGLSPTCAALLTKCNTVGYTLRSYICLFYGYICLPKREPITDCTQERKTCNQLSGTCHNPDNANRFEECKTYGQKCFGFHSQCPAQEATQIEGTSDVTPAPRLSPTCAALFTKCNTVGYSLRSYICQSYGYVCLPKREPITDCTQERETCSQLSGPCRNPDNANRFEECKTYGQKCLGLHFQCPTQAHE